MLSGIDKYGNQTRIISSYTSNSTDALKREAFDGDAGGSYVAGVTNQYMQVDNSVWGKNIRVVWYSYCYTMYIKFLDENKNVISYISEPGRAVNNGYGTMVGLFYDKTYNVPANTRWIKYEGNPTTNIVQNTRLYEIIVQ